MTLCKKKCVVEPMADPLYETGANRVSVGKRRGVLVESPKGSPME